MGDRNPARTRNALQPRGDVDTVAENVIAFDNHIPQVNADAEFDAALLRHIGVSLPNSALNLYGARHRAHHAWEFHEDTIAR